MFGTQTTWMQRVSASLSAVDRAWKAAPTAADLYPPGAGAAGAPTWPIVFPGWDKLWGDQAQGNRQDEQRARTAVSSPWVFSDVTAIANEMSAAELIVKERKGLKLEDVDNHELEVLWESPNEHMGRSFLTAFWAWSYTLSGKAFLYWMPSGGMIREVWPIPPFMIQPVPATQEFIGGYLFKATAQSKPILIPREFITYSHSVNIFDIRDGLSFLAAAMLGIKADLAAEQWNLNNFSENNAVPDGIIAVPRDTLDQDLERVRMEIRAFFGGTRRGVAVARAGDLDYKPFGRSQKEMEFIQLRQFSEKEIDRTLGFPQGYWSERANRANAEQARATMIAGAVWPLLVRLAEDMNAQTIPRWWGDQYRVEFGDIRPEDRDLKLKELAFYAQIETIDELRQRIGDKAIGDVRGLMLLKELEKGAGTPTSAPSDAIEDELAEREAEAAAQAPPEEEALPDEQEPPPEGETPAIEAAPAIEEGAPSEEEAAPLKTAELTQKVFRLVDGMRAQQETDAVMTLEEATAQYAAGDTAFDRRIAETAHWLESAANKALSDIVLLDLAAWRRKAIKAVKVGKSADVRFESSVIPRDTQASIRAALTAAADADSVVKAFAVKDQSAQERAMFAAMGGTGKLREKNSKGDRTGPHEPKTAGGGGGESGSSFDAKTFTDSKAADEWGRDEFGSWANGLSSKERGALVDYQGHAFESINGGLRSGDVPKGQASTIKALDSALSKKTLPHDMELYRGMDMSSEGSRAVIDTWEPGSTFQDKGYLSTSLDKHMAHNEFVETKGPKATITVRAPKGTHAGYMNAASNNHMIANEQEMLLPRNTNYRVVSKTKTSGGVHVVLEVVP